MPEARVAPTQQPGRFGAVLLGMSLMLNLIIGAGFLVLCAGISLVDFGFKEETASVLKEKHVAGSKSSSDKIAVISLEGVIMEGMLDYAERQIDQAAEDKQVKAVVLRINSPGGSITASDQLHYRLMRLRDGDPVKGLNGKPIVVSMASMAASGGYYIAMPAKVLVAERTTMTGSIGVYASFPNVVGLADKVGVHMTVVKRGDVKTAGSPFHDMRPEERELWDSTVGHAYDQFKEVVEQGRPALKGKLEEKIVDERRLVNVEKPDGTTEKKEIAFVRRRADGGIFTSDEALKFGLIDKIGYLETAIAEARQLAGLDDEAHVIQYKKPLNFSDLLSVRSASPGLNLDPARLVNGMTPRLWFLAPQSDLAGILAAGSR